MELSPISAESLSHFSSLVLENLEKLTALSSRPTNVNVSLFVLFGDLESEKQDIRKSHVHRGGQGRRYQFHESCTAQNSLNRPDGGVIC